MQFYTEGRGNATCLRRKPGVPMGSHHDSLPGAVYADRDRGFNDQTEDRGYRYFFFLRLDRDELRPDDVAFFRLISAITRCLSAAVTLVSVAGTAAVASPATFAVSGVPCRCASRFAFRLREARVHPRNTGEAIKMDEYVPTTTPMIMFRAKS